MLASSPCTLQPTAASQRSCMLLGTWVVGGGMCIPSSVLGQPQHQSRCALPAHSFNTTYFFNSCSVLKLSS